VEFTEQRMLGLLSLFFGVPLDLGTLPVVINKDLDFALPLIIVIVIFVNLNLLSLESIYGNVLFLLNDKASLACLRK
jgi:hypothetical protein